MKNHLFIASMCITLTSVMHAESFDSFEQAFVAPEKAAALSIKKYDPAIKHLPSQLGILINLVELDISCLENLEDLPSEIGNLKKLEKLIIDNGNSCRMNVSIPESIGQLENLKVLRLYGALDARVEGSKPRIKNLPKNISNLKNLEELDLGRNGLKIFPSQLKLSSNSNLKKFNLSFNEIHELPSFIGELKNLVELDVSGNSGIDLPKSLANLNGLKIFMGNNSLKIREQQKLRRLFPKVNFDFANEFDGSNANEEPGN
jgi:leucine-rich repeat protein SHOC2